MAKIIIYTKANCAYCDFAKAFLNRKHLNFEEIRIDLNPNKLEEMLRLSGRRTTPQIFINNQPIGGYDDLTQLDQTGKLEDVLKI